MIQTVSRKLLSISPGFVQSAWARVEASPIGYRLARGAFWSLLGAIVSRGFGLASTILAARMLGSHGFGELGIIQSTVGLFGTVAGFGMGTGSTKYVAEFRNTDPLRAGRLIGLANVTTWVSSGLLALVLFITAPWVAATTLAAPQLSGLLQVGAILLLLGGINGVQSGALSGFEAFKSISKIGMVTGLASPPITVIGVWLWGVDGAVWALVGASGLNCVLNWRALRFEAERNGVLIRYDRLRAEWRILMHFNIPGVLNSLMLSFSSWACAALLVNQEGGYSGMGVFNAVKRISQVPEQILGILMTPLLPVLSQAHGQKDKKTYSKVLLVAFSTSSLVIVPFSLLQIASPGLTLMPYGGTYSGGDATVQWVMGGGIVYGLLWPLGSVLVSSGRMWMAFLLVSLNTAIFLSLGLLLVPRFGAAGYAAAGSLTLLLSNIPSVLVLQRHFGDSLFQCRWRTMTLLAAALGFLCLGASGLAKWLGVLVGLAAATTFAIWRARGAANGLLGKLNQEENLNKLKPE